MSSIHKLGIIGIRSYSPEEEVVLRFFKPLTLILGKNGAGKTTIIECLKMAVCGSFPPNSQQGKTFVCDPKLVNKPEVKAKIEIAFTAVNHRKILGVRTFQLTNTAKKTEFRQMEQVLKAKDLNGDIISVTQKCSEMDRQIPELLGVSQAVLDNVIFCHQEESLWPFGDTAKLKSIFDELFDTTRYTTLLENLKKVQKDYKKMAKEALNQFELEKRDFDQLMKTQKNAVTDMNNINELQKQLDDSKAKVKAIKDKMKPVLGKAEIEKALNIVKFRISEIEKQKRTLTSYFESNDAQIFTENSLEELIRCKDELSNNYKKKEEEVAQMEEKLEALRKNKEVLQRQYDQLQLDRDLSEINIKIKDYKDRIVQIITVDLVGNETDVKLYEKVLMRAQSQYEQLSKEVATESAKLEEQEQSIENDLNNFRSSLSSKEGLYEINENELRTVNMKIPKLTDDINRINKMTKGAKGNFEEELESITDTINNLKEDITSFNENLNQKTKELVECTEQMTKNASNKEYVMKYQEYNSHLKDYKNAEQEYKAIEDEMMLLSKNLMDISNMQFQSQDSMDDLIQSVELYQEQIRNEKRVIENKRERNNDQVKEVNSYVQIKQADLHEKMRAVEEFSEKMRRNKMQHLLEGDGDFFTQYKSIKDQLKQIEKRDLAMNYTEDIMMKLLEKSQKGKKCAICTRKLEETELKKLSEKCKEIVNKSASFTGNEQRTLEEYKTQKTLFKSMKNEYEDYRKDKAAIDQLKKEIHAKEKERNIAQQQFNNLKISLTNYENIEAVISDIMKAKEKLEKAQEERRKIKSKIDDILRSYPNIKDYRGQQSSGFDERVLTDKMESIKTTITALRKKIASTDDQIQTFQTQKEEIERKRGAQQKDSFDIGNKVQELDTLKKRKAELDESVNKLTEETEILRTRIEGLEEKRKQLRINKKQLDEKKSVKLMRLKEYTEEFKKLYDVWVRSQDKKKKNQETDAMKDKLSKDIQTASDDIAAAVAKLQKLKDNIKEKAKNLKLIDDNIQLRNFEKELEDLETDQAKLTKNLDEVEENERYNRQLQIEMDREIAKTYQSEGKCSILKSNYEGTIQELKTKWSTTEKSYVEKLFDANVNQYVVDDLTIYIDNLERSLMLFHKQKMSEINKIVADLWMKTYQGADIRKIEIKSDTEPNSKNKSFNYRIVFYNPDGKELDMKGRCSMGQKVIASIVIRLALAEAFCTNCGILALDEPTTNLDKEHIKKLAKQLCNLIEDRMNNENFQLIIITHDKEFLREVSEHAEEYYRVFKDTNSFSKIERKRTSTL